MGGAFILLLEQDDDVRKLLVTYLTREGFQVLSAVHPQEAIRVSTEYDKQIAVVISETLVPRLPASNPAMRVILTSPSLDECPRGIVHLPKPFHLTALKEHLLAMFDD